MRFLVTIAAIMMWTAVGFLAGKHLGASEGRSTALKEALHTNPPSEELEMVCAGLWVGEQNRKYWRRDNGS